MASKNEYYALVDRNVYWTRGDITRNVCIVRLDLDSNYYGAFDDKGLLEALDVTIETFGDVPIEKALMILEMRGVKSTPIPAIEVAEHTYLINQAYMLNGYKKPENYQESTADMYRNISRFSRFSRIIAGLT